MVPKRLLNACLQRNSYMIREHLGQSSRKLKLSTDLGLMMMTHKMSCSVQSTFWKTPKSILSSTLALEMKTVKSHILILSPLENNKETSPSYPGGILNVPLSPGVEGRCHEWRRAFLTKVFPRLCEFKPDFILISAGFDAHEKDHLHNRGDTSVTEFDYQWITEQLVKIAN